MTSRFLSLPVASKAEVESVVMSLIVAGGVLLCGRCVTGVCCCDGDVIPKRLGDMFCIIVSGSCARFGLALLNRKSALFASRSLPVRA